MSDFELDFDGNTPCVFCSSHYFYIVYIVKVMQIVIPIALIIWAIISYILARKSKNKKRIEKAKKPFIIKLVIAVIVFIMPSLFTVIVNSQIKTGDHGWKTCWKCSWIKVFNRESLEFKPVIYIYPKEETDITVTIPNSDKLLVSYPKYTDGWNVKAYPDGTLIDNKTGRELYSLYYESNYDIKPDMNTGFVVKGEDTISFLEEKLAIIGLNDKEAEEFIVYWLPILQNNKYNYIYFATTEELNEKMPLEFSKEPDTLIRTLMMYKPLNKEIKVKEQKLKQGIRSGYTVIEWGGSLIK